jgi:hypothetical protein
MTKKGSRSKKPKRSSFLKSLYGGEGEGEGEEAAGASSSASATAEAGQGTATASPSHTPSPSPFDPPRQLDPLSFLPEYQGLDSAEAGRAAVAAFDEIIDAAGGDRMWRNQAMVFKAKCLELLDDQDQALEIYFDVVTRAPTEGLRPDQAPEYVWYYRAGFAAIGLLQEQQNWRAAANLADRLGQTLGSRALEAAELGNRIRLQHFLWGDSPSPTE